MMMDDELDLDEHASLCEAIDRVLTKGAVVVGDLTISVADVDLVYLGLQVVLTSIETGRTLARAGTAIRPGAADDLR